MELFEYKKAYETGGFPYGFDAGFKLDDGKYVFCAIYTCQLKEGKPITKDVISIQMIYDSDFDLQLYNDLHERNWDEGRDYEIRFIVYESWNRERNNLEKCGYTFEMIENLKTEMARLANEKIKERGVVFDTI